MLVFCFFQAEDGIRDLVRSRGLGDVYKRQIEFFLRNSVSRPPIVWSSGALLLLSIVLASMPFFQLVGRWQDYSQYGVLFIANLSLLLAAHALTLRPAARSGRPAAAAEPASAAP